jgi:hypothetical protein
MNCEGNGIIPAFVGGTEKNHETPVRITGFRD